LKSDNLCKKNHSCCEQENKEKKHTGAKTFPGCTERTGGRNTLNETGD